MIRSVHCLYFAMLAIVFLTFATKTFADDTTSLRTHSSIVVLNMYYAKPGMENEVLKTRQNASNIRASIGLPRGRILRRINEAEELPDVLWECEFPDIAAHDRDMAARADSDAFEDVRSRMRSVASRFERTLWRVAYPSSPVSITDAGLLTTALDRSAIVITNWYFAHPGQEHAVMDHRIHASVVREQTGGRAGRVFSRVMGTGFVQSGELPEVMWQTETPTLEDRQKDRDSVGSSPEFEAVMDHMGTLLQKFDRGVWEIQ
jgi:hypothetical protein